MEEVEQVEAAVEPQQQQPNLTQEQLNRLIQDRMAKAADKARAEAETKHQAEMEQYCTTSRAKDYGYDATATTTA
jgi:hypothetical protein